MHSGTAIQPTPRLDRQPFCPLLEVCFHPKFTLRRHRQAENQNHLAGGVLSSQAPTFPGDRKLSVLMNARLLISLSEYYLRSSPVFQPQSPYPHLISHKQNQYSLRGYLRGFNLLPPRGK